MAVIVDFYGISDDFKSVKVGTIIADGDKFRVVGEYRSVRNVAKMRIRDAETKRPITIEEDPERFVSSLPATFRSPYFGAVLRRQG